ALRPALREGAQRRRAQLLPLGRRGEVLRPHRPRHRVQEEISMAETPAPLPPSAPLLAVRDVVLFPHMTLPLSVGRDKSVKALEEAMRRDHRVMVVAQKAAQTDDPKLAELYAFGVVADVVQFLKMPDGALKVFLQGLTRAKVLSAELDPKGFWTAGLEYP